MCGLVKISSVLLKHFSNLCNYQLNKFSLKFRFEFYYANDKVFFFITFLRNDMREHYMNSIINLQEKSKDVQFIAFCKHRFYSLIHNDKKQRSNLENSGKNAKCDIHVYSHFWKKRIIGIIFFNRYSIFSILLNELFSHFTNAIDSISVANTFHSTFLSRIDEFTQLTAIELISTIYISQSSVHFTSNVSIQ